MDRQSIFAEIQDERARQDEKWGGPDHDDGHTSHDWIAYIVRHMGKGMYPAGPSVFRRQMIRVAALAVAAVESIDRSGSRTERADPVPAARCPSSLRRLVHSVSRRMAESLNLANPDAKSMYHDRSSAFRDAVRMIVAFPGGLDGDQMLALGDAVADSKTEPWR